MGAVHIGFWCADLGEGEPRSRWEDNIKMDLREVGCGIDWVNLAQDRER
jgi:hypothetical protein